MNLGFGQLLFILFLGLLLFGNLPSLLRDLTQIVRSMTPLRALKASRKVSTSKKAIDRRKRKT